MNAKEFHNKLVQGYFRPIYSVIAENILKKIQTKGGICADIGCGSGNLGIEIARKSNFKVFNIDPNKDFIELSISQTIENNLTDQVISLKGSAEHIPLCSNSIDLVVSRGSIYFWKDQLKGLLEVYRIMKPGGFAYIGGGMGNTFLAQKINQQLSTDLNWLARKNERYRKNLPIHHKLLMKASGISNWELESSQEGTWILITK